MLETDTQPVSAGGDRLRAALDMAARGLPVFPLRPLSKKPFAGEGIKIASRDPAQIAAWFAARPGMNYGVCTDDHVVLDVDVKNGMPGLASLETLGAIPATLQVATPTNGLHIYLGLFDAGLSDIAPGINVRSFHGYVVGPGSSTPDGVYKVTQDLEIAPTPQHIALRLKPPGTVSHAAAALPPGVDLDQPQAIARGVAWLETLQGAAQGTRDNTGYAVACHLKDYGLSPATIVDLMADHWNDKNAPPLDAWELEKVAHNAFASGRSAPGVRAPESDFEALELPELEQPVVSLFRPFVAVRDPLTVERRQWLAPDLLLRGQLTGLISPGGLGKSSLALAIAIGVCLGDLSPLGFASRGAAPVVWISTEEDDTELWRRVYGYCTRHGIPLDAIEGRLHVFDGSGYLPFKAVARDPNNPRRLVRTKMLHGLSEYIEQHGVGLVVFDPFVEIHDASENDNAEVAQVMAAVRGVCRSQNCAGIVVHHSRKSATTDGSGADESSRGAGALVNGLRINFRLARPSPDDAAALGLSTDEAAPLFRMDKGKANYLPPGAAARWFRTTGVALPDPRDGLPVDHTHAVELFDPEPHLARVREAYHLAIADAVSDAGGRLSLGEAVATVAADPVLGMLPEPAIKAALLGMFSGDGVTVGGVTLRMYSENPASARPRKVIASY